MNPRKIDAFESQNARLWDDDTTTPEQTSAQVQTLEAQPSRAAPSGMSGSRPQIGASATPAISDSFRGNRSSPPARGGRGRGRGGDRGFGRGRGGSRRGGGAARGNSSGGLNRGGHHQGSPNTRSEQVAATGSTLSQGRASQPDDRSFQVRTPTRQDYRPARDHSSGINTPTPQDYQPAGDRSSGISTPTRQDSQAAGDRSSHSRPPTRPNFKAAPTFVSNTKIDVNKKTHWAVPPKLLKTREALAAEQEAEWQAEAKRFLRKPNDDEQFVAFGLYQWPFKDEDPSVLLNDQLKDLDHLRSGWRVYIEWMDSIACFVIKATSPAGPDDVVEVIKGIRTACGSARARVHLAAPVYICAPPKQSTGSSIVLATVDSAFRTDGKKHLYDLKFAEKGTHEELKSWNPEFMKLITRNKDKLHSELSKQLEDLSRLQNRMVMRINFGQLHLTHWQTDLSDSKQTFSGFAKMMKRSRTTGKFDKKLDVRVAAALIEKFKTLPDRFSAFDPQSYKLSDVKANHVVEFYVESSASGEKFRVEATIDELEGGYQSGTVKAFAEGQQTKCVEIITVDIERVDWNIEINSETTTQDGIYQAFQTLVENCVLPLKKSVVSEGMARRGIEEREDAVGHKYPGICPRAQYGLVVINTSLRSSYRFRTSSGGYCVELTINREWPGTNTAPEPQLWSNVTAFHDLWDLAMESTEHAIGGRDWEKDMSNFFPEATDNFPEGLAGLSRIVIGVQDFMMALNNSQI